MTPAEMTAHFHAKIPISREMGLRVVAVSSAAATVAVELAPNLNHVQTAFGGSLYAAAALACYALFQAISQEAGGLSNDLVIQEGQIKYSAPVDADFQVQAAIAIGESRTRFVESVRRHGKARLQLTAQVFCRGQACAQFSGLYVFKSK